MYLALRSDHSNVNLKVYVPNKDENEGIEYENKLTKFIKRSTMNIHLDSVREEIKQAY